MNDWDVSEHKWVVSDGYIPYVWELGYPASSTHSPRLRWRHCSRIDMRLRNGQIIRVKLKEKK